MNVGPVDLPIDEFVVNMRIYFGTTGDRKSKVWVFREDVPSKFLSAPFCAGDDDFRVELIDLFKGRHPLLINHDSLTNEIHLGFRPTAILDSNVVSYLHQYVRSDPALPASRRHTIRELLQFFIKGHFDYNPFFYYIEGSSRQEQASLLGYASKFSESILRLHTMDNSHFLATGEIKVDEAVLELYTSEFGKGDFSELAAEHAKAMVLPVPFELQWRSKMSYATLLKIAMIHRTCARNVARKHEELRMFMEKKFNVALGIERMLALEYFAGHFQNFIPIQKGANPDRIFKRVRAAAWDLLLLDLPAYLLVIDNTDGISLGFPCTSDRALCSIGRVCSIEMVMAWAPREDRPVPVMGYDFRALERDIGTDLAQRIRESDQEWQEARRRRDLHSEKHISFEELEALIRDLECEVTAYCES